MMEREEFWKVGDEEAGGGTQPVECDGEDVWEYEGACCDEEGPCLPDTSLMDELCLEIKEQTKRILASVQNADQGNVEFIHTGFMTVCDLNRFVVAFEKLGRPATHIVVNAELYGDMRLWGGGIREQLSVAVRAAGWVADIWTMKIFMHETGAPENFLYVGSLLDDEPDVAMRFRIDKP